VPLLTRQGHNVEAPDLPGMSGAPMADGGASATGLSRAGGFIEGGCVG